MGFTELKGRAIGTYRNHNVAIDNIGIGGMDDTEPFYKARYSVDFDNKPGILVFIKRNSLFGARSELGKNIRTIHRPKLEFDGLELKGNKEDEIKDILDSAICTKIIGLKYTMYQIEIGGRYTVSMKYTRAT
jgi:hypothetical protein